MPLSLVLIELPSQNATEEFRDPSHNNTKTNNFWAHNNRDLVKYVNTLSLRGLPPTNAMLRDFAKDIAGKLPGHN